ncbi:MULTISPECIES: hypothetical protein [unclassified Streptomyces]|uniref:hypothetical protein n=1 Tax=Streptomycetaceae TaxID=2062 RepID=UPI002E7A1F03|nr:MULTISPECIES: hypothetical protein [unclassified Streptomyces]MED7949575.1 hypothetical protein [Streptomyces sp. BE303]MEE1821124.1 hypothetical protein [Streptomyces sp. BE20]
MRIRQTVSVLALGAVLAVGGAVAAPAQAQTGLSGSIPSYCVQGSDSNYFGVHCATQKIYKVKAYCDSSDGRHTVLSGNDASNNGWSKIHCNTLGAGWRYRAGSGTVVVR